MRLPRPRDGAVNGQVREAEAFRGCRRLCEAEIRNKDAFRECLSLGKVVVLLSVELIGDPSFYDCALLEEAELRDRLGQILSQAFCNCK